MKGWNKQSIGEIAKVTSSKRIFLSDYVELGIPFWRSKEVIEQFHGKNVSTELFIAKEKYNEIKAKFGVPNKGDILLTSVGTVGVPHLVKNDSPFYFKDGNLTWIKDIIAEVEPYYIYLWLSSNEGQKEIQNNLIGSSQKALTIDSLKKIKILLPPLLKQKKIAGILSAYDDAIENNLRRIKLLEEMAQITYEEWFVRLRFPGHKSTPINEATGLPEGWENYSLSRLGEYLNGYAFKPDDLGSKGMPIIKIKEIKAGVVANTPRNSGEYIPNKYFVSTGDILFSWSASLEVVIWQNETGLLNQHLFKVTPANGIPRAFLYLSLRGALKIFDGLTTGATMKHIKRKELDFVEVIVPSKKIIDEFGQIGDSIFNEILNLSRQNQRLREARDILLPRLMTGVIDAEKYQPENFLKKN